MAYRLHLDGLSHREIAETVRRAVAEGKLVGVGASYSHGRVHADIKACIARITKAQAEDLEPRRQKMRDRLERLFAQAWKQSRGVPDRSGNPTLSEEDRIGWSGEARSTLDQLAKMDGLYAPTKVAPTNLAGDKPFDISEAIDPAAVGLRAANLFAGLFAKLGPEVFSGDKAAEATVPGSELDGGAAAPASGEAPE